MHPSFINWPSSNDKLQYPPQATSRCWTGRIEALSEINLTSEYEPKSPWLTACDMCGNIYSDEEDLDRHLRKHHSRKSESVYSCNLCDYITTCENSLESSIKSNFVRHMKEEHTHWYRECTTIEWGKLKLKSHIRDAFKALEYNILKRHESNEMQSWRSYPGMSEIIEIARDIVENNNKKDVDKLANMIKVHECQQSAVVVATIALIVGNKIGSKVDIDEEIKDKI